MGDQAELSIENWDEEEDEEPRMVQCLICGEEYWDDGENGCCMIDS